jgi:hypothetical protein
VAILALAGISDLLSHPTMMRAKPVGKIKIASVGSNGGNNNVGVVTRGAAEQYEFSRQHRQLPLGLFLC